MFRFAHPVWLLTLLLIPVLLLVHRRRGRPATLQYSDLRLMHGLPQSARLRLRWIPTALRLAALTLLVLAIARPPYSDWSEFGANSGERYAIMPIGIPGPAADQPDTGADPEEPTHLASNRLQGGGKLSRPRTRLGRLPGRPSGAGPSRTS